MKTSFFAFSSSKLTSLFVTKLTSVFVCLFFKLASSQIEYDDINKENDDIKKTKNVWIRRIKEFSVLELNVLDQTFSS